MPSLLLLLDNLTALKVYIATHPAASWIGLSMKLISNTKHYNTVHTFDLHNRDGSCTRGIGDIGMGPTRCGN